MYFRLMGKLNARRNNMLEENEKGFTLIELLVVVIIIGILAAIAIPVYLNVTNNAKNNATQSDVTNMKTAVVALQTQTGSLPAATTFNSTNAVPAAGSSPDWAGAGATLSQNTTSIAYAPASGTGASAFCITGTSTTGTVFYATQSSGVVTGTKPSGC